MSAPGEFPFGEAGALDNYNFDDFFVECPAWLTNDFSHENGLHSEAIQKTFAPNVAEQNMMEPTIANQGMSEFAMDIHGTVQSNIAWQPYNFPDMNIDCAGAISPYLTPSNQPRAVRQPENFTPQKPSGVASKRQVSTGRYNKALGAGDDCRSSQDSTEAAPKSHEAVKSNQDVYPSKDVDPSQDDCDYFVSVPENVRHNKFNFVLVGRAVSRVHKGKTFDSYRCSDRNPRILSGEGLEAAKKRTRAYAARINAGEPEEQPTAPARNKAKRKRKQPSAVASGGPAKKRKTPNPRPASSQASAEAGSRCGDLYDLPYSEELAIEGAENAAKMQTAGVPLVDPAPAPVPTLTAAPGPIHASAPIPAPAWMFASAPISAPTSMFTPNPVPAPLPVSTPSLPSAYTPFPVPGIAAVEPDAGIFANEQVEESSLFGGDADLVFGNDPYPLKDLEGWLEQQRELEQQQQQQPQ